MALETKLGIGVDVGGTTIKIGLVDSKGEILEHTALVTPAASGPDAVLRTIADGVTTMLDHTGDNVVGIGVGLPGVVNNRGEVAYPPNFPGWDVVPVADRLRTMLQGSRPIAVENDANVAAYAEAHAGAGGTDKNFLFVTLGTGVGGCIISDGAIWRGSSGGAGEVGHTTIDINGQLCNCGSRGCIEAYIGHRYMSAIAAGRLERDEDSMLHAWVATGKEVDPKMLDEAAMSGDRFAIDFLREMGELLGAALASNMNLLDLPLVIVGGGLSRAEKTLLAPARRAMKLRVLKGLSPIAELRVARFSNDAGMIGAALLAMST